jgi:hypothetical protein
MIKGFPPGGYSIFTSGVYKAVARGAAFPQEKPHLAEPDWYRVEVKMLENPVCENKQFPCPYCARF